MDNSRYSINLFLKRVEDEKIYITQLSTQESYKNVHWNARVRVLFHLVFPGFGAISCTALWKCPQEYSKGKVRDISHSILKWGTRVSAWWYTERHIYKWFVSRWFCAVSSPVSVHRYMRCVIVLFELTHSHSGGLECTQISMSTELKSSAITWKVSHYWTKISPQSSILHRFFFKCNVLWNTIYIYLWSKHWFPRRRIERGENEENLETFYILLTGSVFCNDHNIQPYCWTQSGGYDVGTMQEDRMWLLYFETFVTSHDLYLRNQSW